MNNYDLLKEDTMAIDKANPNFAPDFDQRLYVRPKTTADPPDIGAYEHKDGSNAMFF